ncbi:hypothetical protein ACFVQB_03095 [Paenibacillus sp. NPDC057886]|uniref:hypothetical protein n=1 Tax=Paenibacillus sp. NPDC057886 TaxID=3346270 RepID=UPI0036B06667
MNAQKANYTKVKARQLQNVLYLAAKERPRRRFHALYDKVYREDVLWEAWKQVKASGGSGGVDGVTLDTIVQEYGAERFVNELANKLRSGTYHPQSARRKEIPKPDGKTRPLGIPVIADRVVQMAAKIVMEPSDIWVLVCE